MGSVPGIIADVDDEEEDKRGIVVDLAPFFLRCL
jgi:hypothetical protein